MRQFKEINVEGPVPFIPWEKLTFENFKQILLHGINMDKPWIARSEKDLMVGSLKFCESFWEKEILTDHPNKETLLIVLD